MWLRSCVHCSHGLRSRLFQLHCILLLNSIHGSSSAVEHWTCMPRCLCFEEEERPPKPGSCQPLCGWRLGYSYIVTCCCMFLSRCYSAVRQRCGLLQWTNGCLLQRIRNLCRIVFHHLVSYRHIVPCYVLDSSFSIVQWIPHHTTRKAPKTPYSTCISIDRVQKNQGFVLFHLSLLVF